MNKLLNCTCAKNMHDIAPLVLRLALGAVFAYHGYDKYLKGVDGVGGFLSTLGFPMATTFAFALIVVELIGGIFIILGLFTHWVAKSFVIVSVVAFLTVHADKGFSIQNGGYEFIITLLAVSVSLMITGAGKYSLDHKLSGHCKDGSCEA